MRNLIPLLTGGLMLLDTTVTAAAVMYNKSEVKDFSPLNSTYQAWAKVPNLGVTRLTTPVTSTLRIDGVNLSAASLRYYDVICEEGEYCFYLRLAYREEVLFYSGPSIFPTITSLENAFCASVSCVSVKSTVAIYSRHFVTGQTYFDPTGGGNFPQEPGEMPVFDWISNIETFTNVRGYYGLVSYLDVTAGYAAKLVDGSVVYGGDLWLTMYYATNQSSAVPEPSSWSMLIGGFGLMGSAMRRRKAAKV